MNDCKEDFFGKLLAQLHIKLFHLLTKAFQKEGADLTFEQFILLNIILKNEGITQQELAYLMNKDKTSIARAINVLENRHKVVRIVLKEDKRKRGLYVTKEGRSHLEKIRPVFKQLKEKIEKSIDEEEMRKLKAMISKIDRELDFIEERL
jgi:DNA-binding MarR family transcriptional regulator